MLAALATVAVLQADPVPSATPAYSYEQCIADPGVFHGCPIPAPDITFLGNGQVFVSGPITTVYQFTEYQNGHAAGTHNEISVRDYSTAGAAMLDGKRGIYIGLVSPCGGSTYYVYEGAFSETPPENYLLTGTDAPTYIGCPTPPANPQVSASATLAPPANEQVSAPTPTDVPAQPVAIGTAETITAASASLPNTGDPTLALVVLGCVLIGGGAATYTLARRRF